ncbi:hypothetical protein PHSC3_001542, partial [Chlamydiales bacterium STE3]
VKHFYLTGYRTSFIFCACTLSFSLCQRTVDRLSVDHFASLRSLRSERFNAITILQQNIISQAPFVFFSFFL